MPSTVELKETIDSLNSAFVDFKKANDERLAQIEKKGHADPTLEDAVTKLGEATKQLDDLKSRLEKAETKLNRPGGLGGGSVEEDENKAEHKRAFAKFMRKGQEQGLKEIEQKALSVGTPADGGYAVPEVIDSSILQLLLEVSPIRSICNVVSVSTSDYKKLVDKRGAASGWVGETTARSETNTPTLAEVAAVMGEIYANPAATQQMLDDAFFNAEQWLSSSLADEFAYQENIGFVSGNGTNKPKGFLAYTTAATADASRTFGVLEHVATGQSGALPASNPADILITLMHKLKAGLRQGARWVMNSEVLATLRKLKDGQGNYLWVPGLKEGMSGQILGYPHTEAEAMPAIASNSLSVAFGNFKRGYTVVDRIGTRVLRDPFTNKPYVHFYTTKRVGGMVIDSEAIKLLKFAAS